MSLPDPCLECVARPLEQITFHANISTACCVTSHHAATAPRHTQILQQVKGMSDERQNRPTFVGMVELPDKIGRQNR